MSKNNKTIESDHLETSDLKGQDTSKPELVSKPVPEEKASEPATADELVYTEVEPSVIVDLINQADEKFADIGGGNEQWFNQAFLPLLQEKNIQLVTKA